jgi:hypothetical protein
MKVLYALLLAANAAHAEPCPDPAVTHQILVEHPTIVAFCEPCGDRVPGEPIDYTGEEVNPAYTYVQTGSARFDNIAALAGCPVAGVSPGLRVEEETADGVLIVPDHSPVAPEAARVVVVQQPVPAKGLGWGAIALGCAMTSALWIAVVRWRRLRAHKPRL